MGIEDLLSIRWRERAELLRRIEEGLRMDSRVRAAWVTGSVARDEDDALSDLDLFIAVSDDAIHDFVENRRVHAVEPARPVLLMDNLANAPGGGAYLLALYEGEVGTTARRLVLAGAVRGTSTRPSQGPIRPCRILLRIQRFQLNARAIRSVAGSESLSRRSPDTQDCFLLGDESDSSQVHSEAERRNCGQDDRCGRTHADGGCVPMP